MISKCNLVVYHMTGEFPDIGCMSLMHIRVHVLQILEKSSTDLALSSKKMLHDKS